MYRKIFLGLTVFLTLVCNNVAARDLKSIVYGDLHVIPAPLHVEHFSGRQPFILDHQTSIVLSEQTPRLHDIAVLLTGYINDLTGIRPQVAHHRRRNAITLKLDATIEHAEGYVIESSQSGITVRGGSEKGLFYGVQTLRKALPIISHGQRAALPAGRIEDRPRWPYRGFMLDVARHFFDVEHVKRVIDILALHGINYFHWHMTDDQGWRIEIKKYPLLTRIGATRIGTIVARGSDRYDDKPISGFYTHEQIREVVSYAAQREITVIPEIDMPGHMLAALAAYPDLGCTGGPYEVARRFGIFDDVLCAGSDRALAFAKDVIKEVLELFPSPYIHIGGDECPKKRWKACDKCRSRMDSLGLRGDGHHSAENQLQAWFMGEIEREINRKGRKMLAWDEILEGNPYYTTTVMAWTSPEARTRAMNEGYRTIACPISHLYFSNPRFNVLPGQAGLRRVYDFEPLPPHINKEQADFLIGAEGCIWTEWVKDRNKLEWQMLPRLAALAEIQWSAPEKKDYNDFVLRLKHLFVLYRLYGYGYRRDMETGMNGKGE